MKSTNINLILNKIHEHGSISRARIAEETGLTAATVTNLTAELIKSGIIVESVQGTSTGGRRPVMLKFNNSQYAIFSVYISSRTLEVGVADFDGQILYYECTDINKQMSFESICDIIEKQYNKCSLKLNKKIISMGVGLHGTVDYSGGNWVFAPNLEWQDIPICSILSTKLGIPVFADNDVKLMAKGEMWYGKAKSISDFAFMYVGEGVGGAAIINRELYRGVSNAGGEVGHCTVDINGNMCSCGNRGCLQTKTNKSAMLEYAKELGIDVSTCDEIVQKAISGDKKCNKILDNEALYLSVGVNTLINVYNPKSVVINSDIKDFDKVILPRLRHLCKIGNRFGNECDIEYCTHSEMSVIKGAAAMAVKEIFANPTNYFN